MLSNGLNNVARILRVCAGRVSLILCVAALFIVSGCVQQFKTPMFQPFDSKGWGPNAMAYNGRDLLIGDRDMVFSLNNIKTGSYSSIHDMFTSDGNAMLSRFPVPLPRLFTICGMAWEGECCEDGFLWVADSQNKELVKLNFNNNQVVKILKMDGEKATDNKASIPTFNLAINGQPLKVEAPHGLTLDGQNLWLADAKAAKIYQISTEDGSVLTAFNSPVRSPSGLAWDCESLSLWVIGYDTCRQVSEDCQRPKLVKFDVKSGKVTHAINLPGAIKRPSALQWMKGNLWVADYNLNRIFIVSYAYETDDDTVYAIEIKPKEPLATPEVIEPIEELPPLQFQPNPAAAEPPPVISEPAPVPTKETQTKKLNKSKRKKHKQEPIPQDLPDK
ncbi:lipoprotein [Candidatus Magnetobacterium bavaricum]|uniref:Lipoprotein n=2 Tax=Candidatus Magnetobacterium bavaricum TaxID=29290 RepID=A0A0F3GQM4_9BACT|nr:lipoprotein [Candidatus Magnetobacterium bavaricum]